MTGKSKRFKVGIEPEVVWCYDAINILWISRYNIEFSLRIVFQNLWFGNSWSYSGAIFLTFGHTLHRKKTNCQILTMTLNATLYKKYLWCLLLLHIKSDCKILICIFDELTRGTKVQHNVHANCTLRNATVCGNHFRIQCRFKGACNFFPV